MVKLHPFPSYQHLNLHLACLFSYLLLCLFSSHGNSSSTYGMKLKLISALALDKRPTLITSATLPPDPCKFARPECNISNVNKIWKMTTSSTSFIERTYLWKFHVNTTSISQDIACSLFYNKFWSVNCESL